MDGELTQVRLRTPTKPLAVSVVESEVGDGDVVRLTVQLGPEQWKRVVDEHLFHLDPKSMGTGFADDADPNRPVDVTLGLDRDAAAGLTGPPESVVDVDQWYALDVHQELDIPEELRSKGAFLRTGFRTTWADDPIVGGGGGSLLDVVAKFFADRELPVERVEGADVFKADGSGENGDWSVWIEVREEEGICLVWSSYSGGVPEPRRAAMMELITRINPDVAVGAFELDLDRGNLSFRTSIDVTGDRLNDALLEQLIGANVGTFDDYLPVIDRVMEEGNDPKAVLRFRGPGRRS